MAQSSQSFMADGPDTKPGRGKTPTSIIVGASRQSPVKPPRRRQNQRYISRKHQRCQSKASKVSLRLQQQSTAD
jgi:hypothetical protein